MLTVGLAEDSKSMTMTGDELTVADSGDDLTKGKMKFARYSTPWLDSFLQHDLQAPALLPVYYTASGMASINDIQWNSGEIFWLIAGSGVG
jgi:hypothetical protein